MPLYLFPVSSKTHFTVEALTHEKTKDSRVCVVVSTMSALIHNEVF